MFIRIVKKIKPIFEVQLCEEAPDGIHFDGINVFFEFDSAELFAKFFQNSYEPGAVYMPEQNLVIEKGEIK